MYDESPDSPQGDEIVQAGVIEPEKEINAHITDSHQVPN